MTEQDILCGALDNSNFGYEANGDERHGFTVGAKWVLCILNNKKINSKQNNKRRTLYYLIFKMRKIGYMIYTKDKIATMPDNRN